MVMAADGSEASTNTWINCVCPIRMVYQRDLSQWLNRAVQQSSEHHVSKIKSSGLFPLPTKLYPTPNNQDVLFASRSRMVEVSLNNNLFRVIQLSAQKEDRNIA